MEILGAANGLEFDGETVGFDYTFEYLVTFAVDGEMYFSTSIPE